MGKKLICLLLVGLVVALVIPVGSAQTQYQAKLFVFGFVKIDGFKHEVRGFAIYGNLNGEVIYFQKFTIKYDGATPILAGGVLPLMHRAWYNPT